MSKFGCYAMRKKLLIVTIVSFLLRMGNLHQFTLFQFNVNPTTFHVIPRIQHVVTCTPKPSLIPLKPDGHRSKDVTGDDDEPWCCCSTENSRLMLLVKHCHRKRWAGIKKPPLHSATAASATVKSPEPNGWKKGIISRRQRRRRRKKRALELD